MTEYQIKIDKDALLDLHEIKFWYSSIKLDLGLRFQKQTLSQISKLKNNPKRYIVRYDDVRCMPINKFPFLVHFSIDESIQTITVHAVFHTSRNPQIWKRKT
jgi:hypothetical protein